MSLARSEETKLPVTADLNGKVVVTPDASTGIGAAAARSSGQSGSKVDMNYNPNWSRPDGDLNEIRFCRHGCHYRGRGERLVSSGAPV
jgi:hypothetical protein